MKNQTIAIITISILIAGGYGIYKLYKKTNDKSKVFENASKDELVKFIVNSGKHSDLSFISSFQEGFLKTWAEAISKNTPIFDFEGKKYNTQGGTSVK